MPYLAVDKNGTEKVFTFTPNKDIPYGQYIGTFPNIGVRLPSGTIRKLIGRDLSWESDPVELTEEMVKEPEKPDYYAGIEWVNDWAKWRGIDEDGTVVEFMDKPFADNDRVCWESEDYCGYQEIEKLDKEFKEDWRNTLQERIP